MPDKSAHRPSFDLGRPDWMANDQGLPCHPSRPMGAVESVLAIEFGPIMAVLARWVASTVRMGAVLHRPPTQDREPGSWPTVVASQQNGPVCMATGRLIWHRTVLAAVDAGRPRCPTCRFSSFSSPGTSLTWCAADRLTDLATWLSHRSGIFLASSRSCRHSCTCLRFGRLRCSSAACPARITRSKTIE